PPYKRINVSMGHPLAGSCVALNIIRSIDHDQPQKKFQISLASFYTIKMPSNVGPSGRILAFESDAFSFGLLQSRIKRAGVNNVEPFQLALGDKTAVRFSIAAYTTVHNRLSKSHREPNVEASEVLAFALDEFHVFTEHHDARLIKDRGARP